MTHMLYAGHTFQFVVSTSAYPLAFPEAFCFLDNPALMKLQLTPTQLFDLSLRAFIGVASFLISVLALCLKLVLSAGYRGDYWSRYHCQSISTPFGSAFQPLAGLL